MTLRFTNTRRDLFFAHCRLALQSRGLRVFLVPLSAWILYSGFTYSGIQDKSAAFKIFYSLLYLALLLGVGALAGIAVTALNALLVKGKGVLGEHTLTITDEGLEERTAYNRTLSSWAALPPVRSSSAYHFVFIAENMAHVVPRKRPPLEGEVDAFVAAVKDRIAGASPATASPSNPA